MTYETVWVYVDINKNVLVAHNVQTDEVEEIAPQRNINTKLICDTIAKYNKLGYRTGGSPIADPRMNHMMGVSSILVLTKEIPAI